MRSGKIQNIYSTVMKTVICAICLLLCALPAGTALAEGLTSDSVTCASAILMDADTGDVLFAKDSSSRMYPASTTKIMTLLVALESDVGLDTMVTIPQEAYTVGKDSSLVPVHPGERMTFRDLLYGFMITSGNDGAISIAVIVSGSEKAFCERMNDRAAKLGCTSTHFANSHGYHNDNHFTTARDMALIAKAAMRNETFRDIVACSEYTMDISTRGRVRVANTDLLLTPGTEFYYAYANGIKTGYTSKAGYCFVGSAEKDGVRLISVALKSSTADTRFTDTRKLLDFGFSQYTEYTFGRMYELAAGSITNVRIANAKKDDAQGGYLALELSSTGADWPVAMIYDKNAENVKRAVDDFSRRSTVTFTHDLTAPIYRGEVIGNISYTKDDGETVTGLLIAARDILEEPEVFSLVALFPFLSVFENPIVLLVCAAVLLIAVLCLISGARKRRRRDKRRRQIYEKRVREERARHAGRNGRVPPNGRNGRVPPNGRKGAPRR